MADGFQKEYKRSPQKFVCLGIDLNNPANLMPPGKFPFLQNVRSYQEGKVESRVGTTRQNSVVLPDPNIHSIFRLNDYINNAFIRFVVANTNLYTAPSSTNVFTATDSGYSGDPVSIVPYRPDQSAVVWAYIADKNRMQKIRSDRTNYQMGVTPPNKPPIVELLQPQYAQSVIPDSSANWTAQGAAAGLANFSRLSGVTIQAILYNAGGPPGWCCIAPTGTDAAKLAPGMRVNIGGAETAVVEEVHYVSNGSGVTIGQIIYDSGTTGLCTIQPTTTLKGLERNTMLLLGGLSEYVRVLSVTNASDGTSSFRCSTLFHHVNGDAITGPTNGNLWLYTTTNRVIGDAITAIGISFTVTATGGTGQGTAAANLGGASSNFANVPSGRPLGPDDYIHIGVRVDNPQNIVEAQLILDVDPATTNVYAATDGNGNAYYKGFRPSDFQPVVAGTQTTDQARATAIQLDQQNKNTNISITAPGRGSAPKFGSGDNSVARDTRRSTRASTGDVSGTFDAARDVGDETLVNPASQDPQTQNPSTQMGAGMSQFTEFKFKISEFTRIGSYIAADLSTIRAIQLRVTVSANVTVTICDLWAGGTYGPDNGNNLTTFLYRYRYRSSATGAKSLPGPTIRSGISALRQAVTIVASPSSDPQVDKIDFERLGGTEPTWHYVGTCPNSSPFTFTDDQFTAAIIVNPPLETDTFQPFPIVDTPKASTVNVAGTAVAILSGDGANVNWARGTLIRINGKVTTLYASPTSSSLLHVSDSLPPGVSVPMEIAEPIIAGSPLPVMWGPYYDTFFACGNTLDPGSVYYTKAFDPDSAPDTNRIEVTSPSETMMNGVMYDGRCYAFSDKRMFSVIPSASYQAKYEGVGGTSAFNFTEIRNGKGLYAKWAFAVGSKIYFLAADGIYETDGGEPVMITTDIRPLFPQGDNPGFAVNGFQPVDMTQHPRLTAHQSYVLFDYTDTSAIQRTLVYDTQTKAWFPDIYPYGLNLHYSESGIIPGGGGPTEVKNLLAGGTNGFLYSCVGTADDGATIPATVWTPAVDFGDTRAKKIYGEVVFDLDPKTSTITATPSIDNFGTDQTVGTFTGAGRVLTNPIDLGAGLGIFARNLGVKFTWTSLVDAPALYYWEPSYLERPEDTFKRADDWNDGGYKGSKLIRGFLIEADTTGASRTFKLQGDQVDIQTYAATHGGQLTIAYAITPPTIATLLRLVPTDAASWRKFQVSYIYEEYPELAQLYTPYTNEGSPGAKYIRGLLMQAVGTGVNATVQYDGDQNGPVIALNHPGPTLSEVPYAFSTPFIAHDLRLAPSAPIRLGKMKWIYDPIPELAPIITEYTEDGYPGAKFVQGLILEAVGSSNATVQYDGDQNGPALALLHPGSFLSEVPYSFTAPFIAHSLRLVPASAIRLGKMKWVWEPAPELAANWITQGTSHDIPGWQFLRDGYIAHISTANINLNIQVDDRFYNFTIPHSGGLFARTYVVFGDGSGTPLKGKLFTYSLTSANPFRLFVKDSEVRVHAWRSGGYEVKHPFGDVSRIAGAKI